MPEGSLWTQAQERFSRNRWAKGGAVVAGLFILAALYAPWLASEVALVWWGDDGFSLPILGDLFNRNSYPKHHDLLFNIGGVLLPFLVLGWWLLRRRWSVGRRLRWSAAIILLGWLGAMAPLLPGSSGFHALWSKRIPSSSTIRAWRGANEAGHAPFAIFPLVPHRVDVPYAGAVLSAPGTVNPVTGARYWLGTDDAGFDVWARMVFGARISLTIGLLATGLGMGIGVLIGAISGYAGGLIDLLLQRMVEIMMCFPVFILILVVVAMVGRDIFTITCVLGLTGWAGTARLVRGEYLAQSGRDYVSACRAAGLPAWRIMFKHILPNCMTPLLIGATFGVAGSVGLESGLAFIGLGDPNVPSWGMLLDKGRANISFAWLIWTPGLAVFLLVSSLNMVGNGLREALDVKAH